MTPHAPHPVDPVTLEVVRNKLDGIADEMEWTLLSASFSPIVKEGLDASAALFLPDGSTLAQACAIPIHLGSLIPSVANILRCFPLETIREGDAYCMNDPYSGGTHIPDLAVVMPIFHEDRIVALSVTMTHHQDTGGMSPGSVPTHATEIFQEGLRIPAVRLFRDGRYDETLLGLIRLNVRMPDYFLGDLNAQVAACRIGARRIAELCDRLGGEGFAHITRVLLDRSELLTRKALRAMPSGIYRCVCFIDNDGVDLDTPVRIEVAVTIGDGTMHFDFTGTSQQVRGPFNCVPSGSQSAAYYVVRALTDPSIPTNGGCFRPVTLHLPPGSLVNPVAPAPVNARAISIKAMTNAMMTALADAAPERVPAFNSNLHLITFGGPREGGGGFVVGEVVSGGMGAHSRGDGNSVMEGDASNAMNMPIEAMEMDYPIRLIRSELRQDSGGAGKWRGGQGYAREYLMLADGVTLTHRGDNHTAGPRGILGGAAGMKAESWIVRADGSRETIPSKLVVRLNKGDRLFVNTAGGGGYGNPADRPRDLIVSDAVKGVR
jgi:N-methylhydantoinase B/oxoprolinase/acetone carboxylase alpha subunit